MSKLFLAALAATAVSMAAPSGASHPGDLGTPFPSRGACEAASAHHSVDDREFLQIAFPWYFETSGDAEAFLTRAFSCDIGEDGNWYITDHRVEVLNSDWFKRR